MSGAMTQSAMITQMGMQAQPLTDADLLNQRKSYDMYGMRGQRYVLCFWKQTFMLFKKPKSHHSLQQALSFSSFLVEIVLSLLFGGCILGRLRK